jgi:hypothetical protein
MAEEAPVTCETCGMVTAPGRPRQHARECPDHDPDTCDACAIDRAAAEE